MKELSRILRRIDSKGYPQYKQLRKTFEFDVFTLRFTWIQGDPFAAPSTANLTIPNAALGLDKDAQSPARRTGYEDAIMRALSARLRKVPRKGGSGNSGIFETVPCGQEMLRRSGCEISADTTTVRIGIGLPADGRRILGNSADEMLTSFLPRAVEESLIQGDRTSWKSHADACEDFFALQEWLKGNKKLAFIADGSCLPRESGVCDKPLQENVVPWKSPKEISCELELPNAGKVTGSAIDEGISLICGGGYHGKSTLLNTIAHCVYPHIPSDGRERCATRSDAVSIRAEDNRNIQDVDISCFIDNLPNGKSTKQFSTPNASGSTSQAANIMEAIEQESKFLLIDEDTSATNFMIRDRRMQELVENDREPITPLIDRIQDLWNQFRVSIVIVVGGSGDYFDVADNVLTMTAYVPEMSTARAKDIAQNFPTQRRHQESELGFTQQPRSLKPGCIETRKGKRSHFSKVTRRQYISIGTEEIDVSACNQLIDIGQTKLISDFLIAVSRDQSDPIGLYKLCKKFEEDQQLRPISACSNSEAIDRCETRRFEVASAINRYRKLRTV
jgi:predicted ABC-class ATPase